jgi:aryl-alcohol dehydrogenase-like predicted oxidoreductase
MPYGQQSMLVRLSVGIAYDGVHIFWKGNKAMADLPKRALGRTGLQVTMLGYGAMELRGAPRGRDVTETQAETMLNAVLDVGINYIDTSIDYGLSEERIGRYIADRRSEYYLASKCGCLVGAPPAPRGQRSPHVFTRDNILAGVEQSLARMKTDYLDVLQFHISPSRQTLEEHGALETMLELKRAGTVRYTGMSGTLPNLKDHIAMGVFDVFQIPYSAVEREHEAIITAAAAAGAGIVVRGGAAKGAPAEGKQAGVQWERWRQAHLDDLLGDMTPMEFILRFTFTHAEMDTNIVGTISPVHLQDNINALRQGPLPPDVYAEAKRRLAAVGSVPQEV